MRKRTLALLLTLCLLAVSLAGCVFPDYTAPSYRLEEVPAFDELPYVILQENAPSFTEEDLTTESFESYAPLDYLGRCGPALACIGLDLMPTEERGSIGQVRPTGWHTVKYEFVDGKYLYNRCHLIGYQLSGENSNEQNLITGTRYLNTEGMLPFEDQVAEYVQETGNHVLYRVTPIFQGENLLASGVEMEALSVEDGGEGVHFHIYAYNNQPGVEIDYATGESHAAEDSGSEPADSTASAASAEESVSGGGEPQAASNYILNTNTKKFHAADCPLAEDIRPENREAYTGDRDTLLNRGYSPCKTCRP